MAEQAKQAPRTRLSQEQRERFLEVLGETGNRRLAAEAIGVEPRNMDQRRRFDRLLDRQWREGLERAERRLAGASGPLDTGRAFNVIRKAPNGQTQIVTAGPKRWSQKVEARFLAALGMCGNVAAAADRCGADDEDGDERPSTSLRTSGDYGFPHPHPSPPSIGRSASEGAFAASPLPQAGGETPFDADMAFRFLKWREAKRQGRASAQGRWAALPDVEEVRARIVRRVEAITRHRDRERLAQGWVEDGDGNWIPPGWVRADPD